MKLASKLVLFLGKQFFEAFIYILYIIMPNQTVRKQLNFYYFF